MPFCGVVVHQGICSGKKLNQMERETNASRDQCEGAKGCVARLQEKGIERLESVLPVVQLTSLLPAGWAMESIGKAIHINPERSSGIEAPLL